MQDTVLVVDDERNIVDLIELYAKQAGYRVLRAYDGLTALDLIEREQPSIVVLDLMLPGFDGLEVCRRIQRDVWVPVLMLTARDSEADMVIGLSVGADDYMTKPFSARELVARVAALLRRSERAKEPVASEHEILRLGGLDLDPTTRRCSYDGAVVHLTPTEFELVMYLGRRPGRVATREELLAQVWGYDFPAGGRTVDSHVRSVRRKLGSDLVRTVHGVGYAIDPSDVQAAFGDDADAHADVSDTAGTHRTDVPAAP